MLGRVRASPSPSPSPLDGLETPPSKIIKDDSLSIYEATLVKLKLGSQRRLVSPPSETAIDLRSATMKVADVSNSSEDFSSDGEVNMDAECCSQSVSKSSSDQQAAGKWNSQHRTKNVSILYLFSKYNCDKHDRAVVCDANAMMIDNDGSASCSSSSEQGKQESSCSSSTGSF